MDKIKKILFIINPIAGTRKKRELPGLIDRKLDKNKFDIDIQYTGYKGHAKEIAQDAAENGVHYVIAVGGDGTVNEVASGLIRTGAALGIIPFGSGNGLARHLNIPMGNEEAIKIIQNERVVKIDGGNANGKNFFCTAGIGFDAHVGKLFAKSTKRGFSTYFQTAFKELFLYEPQLYSVKYGEELVSKKAFSITLANASQFGNNAYIAPQADIKDGMLDLCIVNPYPKQFAIHLGYRLFNRTFNQSRFVETHRVKEVEIFAEKADCFHLDGEHFELKEGLKINVMESCLNVLVGS